MTGWTMARMGADEREALDRRCHGLLARGMPPEYVASATGTTVGEVLGAARRVECGRYGPVEGPGRGGRDDEADG